MKLDVADLTFSYGKGPKVLDGISFAAGEKECIGLIGANGAGKTTLLKLMVGLLVPSEGRIAVGDTVLTKRTLAEVRRRIGYVFQDSDSQLFMTTVYEDIAFGPRNYGCTPEETDRRVRRAMELTGCAHLKDRQIHRLSGGEKKLVSVATVLSLDPDILLMDEPSNALDPQNRRRLIRVLDSLPCIRLIATHDLDMVWELCGRVLLISGGRIIADGSTRAILSDEALLAANGLELPLSARLYAAGSGE